MISLLIDLIIIIIIIIKIIPLFTIGNIHSTNASVHVAEQMP